MDKAILKWFFLQRSQNITIDGTTIKEKEMFFAKETYFPNVKASDGWIDKTKKGKEKNTNTVNKKFIFLNQLFTGIFACKCASLCNHFMLVCCFNISTMEFCPDKRTPLCLILGSRIKCTRVIVIKIS